MQEPFSRDDHFGNAVRANIAGVRRMFNKVGKLRDSGEWEMIPSEVNAYYSPPSNEVSVQVNSPKIVADTSLGLDRLSCWYTARSILQQGLAGVYRFCELHGNPREIQLNAEAGRVRLCCWARAHSRFRQSWAIVR